MLVGSKKKNMNRTRYEGHHAAIQKNEECEDIARYCSASRRKEKGGGEREKKKKSSTVSKIGSTIHRRSIHDASKA